MRIGSILLLWVALSLLTATPVRATLYFFPQTPLFGQPYYRDEFTLTQDINHSGNPLADRVIIGYESDSTNPFSLPYPFRKPHAFILNVPNDITINPYTLVYAGSTLNLRDGSQMSDDVGIYDDSTLNVTGATVEGSVTVYSNGKVNLTNATMNGNVTGNATSNITVNNTNVLGQLTTGNSFNPSGSTFGSVVTTGSASVTLSEGQVFRGASALGTSTMILNGLSLSSSIAAHNSAVMNVGGGSVGGDVHANHFSSVTLSGGVEIRIGAYAYGGTIVLENGTIAGGVTVGPHPTAAGGIGTFLMSGGTVSSGLSVGADAVAVVSAGTINGDTNIDGANLTYSGADLIGNVAVSSGGTMTMSSGYVSGSLDVSGGGGAYISDGLFGRSVSAIGATVKFSGKTDVGGDVLVTSGGSFEMSGGFVGEGITVENHSDAYITDGLVIGGLNARRSDVTIAGGTFRGDVAAYGGKVDISGGLIEGNLLAADGAVVTLSGGKVTGHGEMRGGVIFEYGGGEFLRITDEPSTEEPLRGALHTTSSLTAVAAITAYDDAVINIYGTDLVATLLDSNYEGGFSQYSFSGMLADGTVINGGTFLLANGGGATYHLLPPPVPEPSTFSLVIVSLLGHYLRRSPRRQFSCA